MKLRTLSAIACTAILGLGLLSGCGSSSSGATGTTVIGADGYVVDLNGSAVTAFCSDTNTTYSTTNLVNVRGAIKFAETLNSNCTVTIPANVRIDAGTSEKPLGFAMRGRGLEGKMVSHLTTLALAQNNPALLSLVEDFNPVTAITDAASDNNTTKNKAQKLLVLGEAVKTVLATGTITDVTNLVVPPVADLNDSTKTASDINTSAISANLSSLPLKTAVENKADAMKALINVLPALKTAGVNIEEAVINISDGGKTLTEALIADGNKTLDGNTTAAVANIDSNITAATRAVTSLPAKLSVGSLKLGDKTVTLNGDSFNTTIDTSEANITDFYDVSFPSVTLTKGFADDANISVSVRLSDANANQVTMSITGATLKAIDNNSSVGITLPVGSTVTVTQSGLSTLQGIIGTSASATVGTELVMNDLGFNVGTVLDALSTNATSISNAISALNTYLRTSNVYDVNISFTGVNNVVTDYTSFAGKVTVKGAAVTEPEQPTEPETPTVTLSADSFTGKVYTFSNGIVLSFTDATHYTMVDSPDTSNGTWNVSGNQVVLSDGTHLTFAAQPAQGVTVTPADVDDITPVTISTITTYTTSTFQCTYDAALDGYYMMNGDNFQTDSNGDTVSCSI